MARKLRLENLLDFTLEIVLIELVAIRAVSINAADFLIRVSILWLSVNR